MCARDFAHLLFICQNEQVNHIALQQFRIEQCAKTLFQKVPCVPDRPIWINPIGCFIGYMTSLHRKEIRSASVRVADFSRCSSRREMNCIWECIATSASQVKNDLVPRLGATYQQVSVGRLFEWLWLVADSAGNQPTFAAMTDPVRHDHLSCQQMLQRLGTGPCRQRTGTTCPSSGSCHRKPLPASCRPRKHYLPANVPSSPCMIEKGGPQKKSVTFWIFPRPISEYCSTGHGREFGGR